MRRPTTCCAFEQDRKTYIISAGSESQFGDAQAIIDATKANQIFRSTGRLIETLKPYFDNAVTAIGLLRNRIGRRNQQYILIGHSAGGAAMMVAGVILLLRGDAGNVTVITYGSPRCVGEQNVRAYLGRTVVNYRAYGDPVWTLPPTGEDWVSAVDAVSQWKGNNDAGNSYGFKMPGEPLYLKDISGFQAPNAAHFSNVLDVIDAWKLSHEDADFVRPHSIGNYRELLTGLLANKIATEMPVGSGGSWDDEPPTQSQHGIILPWTEVEPHTPSLLLEPIRVRPTGGAPVPNAELAATARRVAAQINTRLGYQAVKMSGGDPIEVHHQHGRTR